MYKYMYMYMYMYMYVHMYAYVYVFFNTLAKHSIGEEAIDGGLTNADDGGKP